MSTALPKKLFLIMALSLSKVSLAWVRIFPASFIFWLNSIKSIKAAMQSDGENLPLIDILSSTTLANS